MVAEFEKDMIKGVAHMLPVELPDEGGLEVVWDFMTQPRKIWVNSAYPHPHPHTW